MALYINGTKTMGSGDILPGVTSADEGKILSVNNLGHWAAQPGATITTYTGTPTSAVQNDGFCTLTKIENNDYIIYQLHMSIHMNGTSEGVEYVPFYTFPSGVIDSNLDGVTYAVYCVYYDFHWSRVRFNMASNSIGGFWGTFDVENGWFSNTPLVYIVPKNLPTS